MVGQWPSREETYFPAGVGVNTTSSVCLFYWAYTTFDLTVPSHFQNTSLSSSTSDRMGAFGTLQLDHEPTPGSEQQHVSR